MQKPGDWMFYSVGRISDWNSVSWSFSNQAIRSVQQRGRVTQFRNALLNASGITHIRGSLLEFQIENTGKPDLSTSN
jgi:hypothetical protein